MKEVLNFCVLVVFLSTVGTLLLFVRRSDARNRMVVVELQVILTTAFIGLLSAAWKRAELLDLILAWALFGFISSAAVSALILREGEQQ